MFRKTCLLVLSVLLAQLAGAEGWRLGPRTLIHQVGQRPSLWNGTVAYTAGLGGAVMLFDGSDSIHVFGPTPASYEPANAPGGVAWRNCDSGAGVNEIFRWNGVTVANISNTSGLFDSDLKAGSNGDLIWSQSHTNLMYYDASANATIPLFKRGEYPALYIRSDGVATYAYQDPDTNEVKYFDGALTHTLGPGVEFGAHPSVHDGAVAWVGLGQGTGFTVAEIFWWKDGLITRVTNDDPGGLQDDYPVIWGDLLIWQRAPSPTSPRLWLWDGQHKVQLTTTGGKYPSFHNAQLAWVDSDGLYMADLLPPSGDCNNDGMVGWYELDHLGLCMGGPSVAVGTDCGCANLDGDEDADLADYAVLQCLAGV